MPSSWTPRPGSPTPERNSTAWTASRRASRCARRWPDASSRRSGRTCTASALRAQRRSHRTAAVAAVVGQGRIAGQGRRRRGSQRRHRDSPAEPGAPLVRLGRQHARLVHIASAVVGPPHPDLARAERRDHLRRSDETPPEGWEQDPDVLDTWFSSALWPFSTLGWPDTARLEVLSDQGFGHRLRHPVLLGGPDDDVRHVRRRRSRHHPRRAAYPRCRSRTSSCTG